MLNICMISRNWDIKCTFTINRLMATFFVCPMRWIRITACSSTAGFHHGSYSYWQTIYIKITSKQKLSFPISIIMPHLLGWLFINIFCCNLACSEKTFCCNFLNPWHSYLRYIASPYKLHRLNFLTYKIYTKTTNYLDTKTVNLYRNQ